MSDAVSMADVQKLLAGSRTLKQMKKDIDATIIMVFGLLTDKESKRFRLNAQVCRFATSCLVWKIEKLKSGFNASAFPVEHPEGMWVYASKRGANRIPLERVKQVYEDLPEVVTQLQRVFPGLRERTAPLLAALPQ